MKLYKHSEEQFNITNGCNTIKIGTLEDFDKLDPNFVAHAGYSEGRITITGKNIESLPISKFSNLSPNIIDTVGGATITAGDVNINNSDTNCYILSCSMESSSKVFSRYGYDSRYLFPKAHEMSELVVKLLAQQLTHDDVATPDLGPYYIQPEHRLVDYYDSL